MSADCLGNDAGWRMSRVGVWLISVLIALAIPRLGMAQGGNGIISPAAGEVVSGVIIIQGTAGGTGFLRYEMAFNNGSDWIVFAEGDQPVLNGTLAIWDTTVGSANNPVYPDGVYQLRLRVVRQDFNYAEYFVPNITVANQNAIATAVGTATGEPAGTEPILPPANTAVPTPEGGLALPTAIPSLTPFPTPSPAATARSVATVGAGQPDDLAAGNGDNGGLLVQLQAVDTGRFGRAFRQGIIITFYLFIALGVYLVVRSLWRWVWRKVR